MSKYDDAIKIMTERFGQDSTISIATTDGGHPHVRAVDGYYQDGAFYVVTYALSNKMNQIESNPEVALCGDWFTAHGIGENLGHVLKESNTEIMAKLREVFASWYTGGHVNEEDVNTCLLRVKLTDGILLNNGEKYNVDFVNHTA